jgi:FAD dependent oxidoreductase TIGR03364
MDSNQYDLIVVGAGVLGTFHAYHAAELGKKVLLLEKDAFPVNATVRNFGQIVPSGMANEWFEYGVYSTRLYKKIQSEFDISIRQNGSVYIASDDDEQQLIHELKHQMDERGYEAQLLSKSQCLSKFPALQSNYCKEGLYFPQEVSAEPNSLIYKLLFYATRKFQTLRYQPNTSVWGCEVTKGKVNVTTNKGELYTSEKVIICNGHEFNSLFTSIFRNSGIVVSKLNMMRTIPYPNIALEGNILTGLTIRRYESFQNCPSYSKISTPDHLHELKKWGIHILFKKAIDNSIIIGDSHEYAPADQMEKLGFELNQEINNLMLKEAARIVQIPNLQIASTWAGFYAQHPDKDVVEVDIENKIHIRTAIGGKGMTSSAGYAKKSIQHIFES